jgi:hypothetical protein
MGAFSVTSVIERPSLDQAGNIRNVTVLYLKTQRGATGSVELPADDFHALTQTDDGKSALRDMLQQRADSLDAPMEF